MVYLFAWESCAWRGRRKPWHQEVLIPTHHRLGRNQEASVVLLGCSGSYGWPSTLACGVSRTFSRSDMEWWVVSGQAGWVTSLFRFVFEWVGTFDSRPRLLRGAGGRLWPQFLVACDRNFWSLVTAWTVTVSLFAAGAIFGHVGVSLLVASALFGDVGGSIFLAGAAFGEIWHSTGVVFCSTE